MGVFSHFAGYPPPEEDGECFYIVELFKLQFQQCMVNAYCVLSVLHPIFFILKPMSNKGKRWPCAGLMLGQCRRRWPNITTTHGQQLLNIFLQ